MRRIIYCYTYISHRELDASPSELIRVVGDHTESQTGIARLFRIDSIDDQRATAEGLVSITFFGWHAERKI